MQADQPGSSLPVLLFLQPQALERRAFPYFPVGIPAGFPSPADDHLQKQLDLNEHLVRHPEATFFAHVSGDSLIDVNILDGDLLVIDRSLEAVHDSIVVAILNGEFVVKCFYKRNGVVKLLPKNPRYPEIEITEGMDFEIWGVVSHVIHRANVAANVRAR